MNVSQSEAVSLGYIGEVIGRKDTPHLKGIPKAAEEALQRAFDQLWKDPEFAKHYKKLTGAPKIFPSESLTIFVRIPSSGF